MKIVTPRAVVPVCSRRQFGAYAVTLALGLPVIALLVHLATPAVPIGYIVVPVLAGGLLPMCALAPRRVNVTVASNEAVPAIGDVHADPLQALQRQPA
jgi:hypothetical protein